MKSYTHLTLNERKCLQELLSEGKSIREIAKILEEVPQQYQERLTGIKQNINLIEKLTINIGTIIGGLKTYML